MVLPLATLGSGVRIDAWVHVSIYPTYDFDIPTWNYELTRRRFRSALHTVSRYPLEVPTNGLEVPYIQCRVTPPQILKYPTYGFEVPYERFPSTHIRFRGNPHTMLSYPPRVSKDPTSDFSVPTYGLEVPHVQCWVTPRTISKCPTVSKYPTRRYGKGHDRIIE